MKKLYIREKLALRGVAAANNTTIERVRAEIWEAIEAGRNNPDPAIQALWAQIPHKGDKPTPEEFIAFLSARIKEEAQSR